MNEDLDEPTTPQFVYNDEFLENFGKNEEFINIDEDEEFVDVKEDDDNVNGENEDVDIGDGVYENVDDPNKSAVTHEDISLESPFSKIATVDYGYPITKTLMSNSSGSASSTTVKRRVRGPNVNKNKESKTLSNVSGFQSDSVLMSSNAMRSSDSKNRVRGPNIDRTHKPTTTEMVDRRTTLGSLNPNTFNRSTINSTSQLTNICDKNLGDHSISGNYVMNVNFTTPLRSAIIDSNNVGIGSFSVPSDRVKIQQTFIVSDDSDTGGFRDTVVNSKQEDAKQRQTVSMREYYCYKVMIRTSEALTLHLAGRLWQQFIVDAFTAIEQ
ncbi:hypothetical protein POM88_002781 [Heracleum sosnowskyi]|uniref:Uncharacterized protein n=1 Tax=Heracleum sosnowskyi TaxID=360622 RepID=A0AAD8JGB8_9APIA|nr:hypothetical protein POM88_002781 [Heracleum sosnowskyi]